MLSDDFQILQPPTYRQLKFKIQLPKSKSCVEFASMHLSLSNVKSKKMFCNHNVIYPPDDIRISDRKHIFSLKAILWVVKLDFEFELTLCKNTRCQFQSAWTLTFLSSLIFHGADWPRLTSHWHSYSVYRFSYATIYGQAEGVSNEVN